MTNEEFKKLQEVQTQIMDEVHEICVRNSIVYYMIGGTLLGAVRHKGFIPWDMDIDIAMPREEYERFKQVCSNQLGARFQYRDYHNTSAYNHPHALVCIKGTKLYAKYDCLNPHRENLGIYLDVFPLDTAPASEKEQERQAWRIGMLKKLKAYRINYSYSASIVKRVLRFLIRFALWGLSVDRINVMLDREMQRYAKQKTGLICSMASHYSYKKQCMSEAIYGKPVLLEFAGREYFAPAKYKEYLERIYGDYMKMPPLEQQKANLEVFTSVVFDK